MKKYILFLLLSTCLQAEIVSKGTGVVIIGGQAIPINSSPQTWRATLGLPDTETTNGIARYSTNIIALDTNTFAVSGTNVSIYGDISTHSGVFTNSITLNGSAITAWPTASGTILNAQGATSALTGNSGDRALYTCSIPSIAAGKGIRWTVYFKNTTATSASKAYKISYGGTTLTLNPSTSTSTTNPFMASGTIMNVPSSTTSQVWGAGHVQNGGSFAQFIGTSAVDTSGAQTLSFIFNAANTEACTGTMFYVETLQ